MSGPPAIPKLSALALAEIRAATARLQQDGDLDRWESTIQKTLAKAHQAAYLLGAAERLGVPVDSPLLNARNLSRAERAELKDIVAEQIDYLRRFVDVAGDLSDAQIGARADMYALAPKQSYWRAWAGGEDLDCLPGQCEECYSNCRCSLDRQPDGIYWNCTDDAHSCASCRERGAQRPYVVLTPDVDEEIE